MEPEPQLHTSKPAPAAEQQQSESLLSVSFIATSAGSVQLKMQPAHEPCDLHNANADAEQGRVEAGLGVTDKRPAAAAEDENCGDAAVVTVSLLTDSDGKLVLQCIPHCDEDVQAGPGPGMVHASSLTKSGHVMEVNSGLMVIGCDTAAHAPPAAAGQSEMCDTQQVVFYGATPVPSISPMDEEPEGGSAASEHNQKCVRFSLAYNPDASDVVPVMVASLIAVDEPGGVHGKCVEGDTSHVAAAKAPLPVPAAVVGTEQQEEEDVHMHGADDNSANDVTPRSLVEDSETAAMETDTPAAHVNKDDVYLRVNIDVTSGTAQVVAATNSTDEAGQENANKATGPTIGQPVVVIVGEGNSTQPDVEMENNDGTASRKMPLVTPGPQQHSGSNAGDSDPSRVMLSADMARAAGFLFSPSAPGAPVKLFLPDTPMTMTAFNTSITSPANVTVPADATCEPHPPTAQQVSVMSERVGATIDKVVVAAITTDETCSVTPVKLQLLTPIKPANININTIRQEHREGQLCANQQADVGEQPDAASVAEADCCMQVEMVDDAVTTADSKASMDSDQPSAAPAVGATVVAQRTGHAPAPPAPAPPTTSNDVVRTGQQGPVTSPAVPDTTHGDVAAVQDSVTVQEDTATQQDVPAEPNLGSNAAGHPDAGSGAQSMEALKPRVVEQQQDASTSDAASIPPTQEKEEGGDVVRPSDVITADVSEQFGHTAGSATDHLSQPAPLLYQSAAAAAGGATVETYSQPVPLVVADTVGPAAHNATHAETHVAADVCAGLGNALAGGETVAGNADTAGVSTSKLRVTPGQVLPGSSTQQDIGHAVQLGAAGGGAGGDVQLSKKERKRKRKAAALLDTSQPQHSDAPAEAAQPVVAADEAGKKIKAQPVITAAAGPIETSPAAFTAPAAGLSSRKGTTGETSNQHVHDAAAHEEHKQGGKAEPQESYVEVVKVPFAPGFIPTEAYEVDLPPGYELATVSEHGGVVAGNAKANVSHDVKDDTVKDGSGGHHNKTSQRKGSSGKSGAQHNKQNNGSSDDRKGKQDTGDDRDKGGNKKRKAGSDGRGNAGGNAVGTAGSGNGKVKAGQQVFLGDLYARGMTDLRPGFYTPYHFELCHPWYKRRRMRVNAVRLTRASQGLPDFGGYMYDDDDVDNGGGENDDGADGRGEDDVYGY